MRRWNGWGDDSDVAELKPGALDMLGELAGRSEPPIDATLEEVLALVPTSRLPVHPLIVVDAEVRLRHSVGQSFPDWLKLRYGKVERFPDGVAFPETNDQVRELLNFAIAKDIRVIPYGGGTSVVGHLTPPAGTQPVLSIDLSRLNKVTALNPDSLIATIQAGATGLEVEEQLTERGYVLGHFPQSWEYSTVGGWVITRSSGQQSLRYGRIENMFAGGTVETPTGPLTIPAIPATGAGTDVREMVLGSEGRIGILTDCLMRVTKLPEHESFHGVFFPSWDQGLAAVQRAAQRKLPLSMMRLSNAKETLTNLTMAGDSAVIKLLERYLGVRGSGDNKVMLMFGVTGNKADCEYAKSQMLKLCKPEMGVYTGTLIGNAWKKKRYHGPYLRNTLWDHGYAADTSETCFNWDNVTLGMNAIEKATEEALAEFDLPVHNFTHLSHVYPQGSSVYSTYIWRGGLGYEEDLARWQKIKAAVSQVIVAHGGTISHQHGVGTDHAPYLTAEKSARGIEAMKDLFEHFDPKGLMNPGKLVDSGQTN